MPVQTRRRGPKAAPAAESNAAAQPAPAKAKKAAPKSKAAVVEEKVTVPAKRAGSKSPKREPSPKRTNAAKSSGGKAATTATPSAAYKGVLSQIQDLGPVRIQKSLVSRKQRSRSKQAGKQAGERLVKRQLLSQELHRLSNPDLLSAGKVQQPKEIKARAQAEEKRRVAGESIKRRALLQEIRTKGDKGLHAILHRPRAIQVAGKSGAKSVASKVTAATSPKQLKGKALVELSELVSPRTAFHPSLVKQKLQVKDTHRQVGLEMMKRAQVQEIKRRSDKTMQK